MIDSLRLHGCILLKLKFSSFQEKQEVVIEKIVRNKRKCVTVVKGLDLFGEYSLEGLLALFVSSKCFRNSALSTCPSSIR